MKSLILSLLLVVSVLEVYTPNAYAQSQSQQQQIDELKKEIAKLKANSSSITLLNVSRGLIAGGIFGMVITAFATRPEESVWDNVWTRRAAIGTSSMLGIGIILNVMAPSPAASATMTDYYLTPDGFEEYKNLSEEQMLSYALMDPRLAELITKLNVEFEKNK